MLSLAAILILIGIINRSTSIPVPNGQLGNVEIECGEDYIEAVFLTEAIFQGRIFVIGHAHEPNCVSRETGRRTTSITVKKSECGVVTTRSTDPEGLFSSVKIMISFHTDFITKVDRGYEISCFYMPGDKTVTYPITVATQPLAGITEIAEMPVCRYEVIDPISRQPAELVTVGGKLLHQWICESTAPNLWCMRVHSCRVEDGSGTEFTILDEQGCSVDRYLLDNLEYGPGDLRAQKEAHAFKFADRVIVNFQCSVRLDIKNGAECPIPDCGDPARIAQARQNQRGRRPRAAVGSARFLNESIEVDVRARQIDVLDPLIGIESDGSEDRRFQQLRGDCIAAGPARLAAASGILLIVILAATVIVLMMRPGAPTM